MPLDTGLPSLARRRIRSAVLLASVSNVFAFTATAIADDTVSYTAAGCLRSATHLHVCAASDMARPARGEPFAPDHPRYRLDRGSVALRALRGETVALQLLVERTRLSAPRRLSLGELPRFQAPDGGASRLSPARFTALYHPVERGRYTWGPTTQVLPRRGPRPDALVPERSSCTPTPSPRNALRLPKRVGDLQAVWIDVHVPSDSAPGLHITELTLQHADDTISIPLSVQVVDAALPERPTIHAVAELYRTYRLEGVGEDPTSPDWQRISNCYRQLAHRHRAIFIERVAAEPTGEALAAWLAHNAGTLDGTLFTERNGYHGPGQGVPVAVWRLPWPQTLDVSVSTPLPESVMRDAQARGLRWAQAIAANGWTDTQWFAYEFDEVDGPHDERPGFERAEDYVRSVHRDMQRMQAALDRATDAVPGAPPIDLLWTSHSNPATWTGIDGLDLAGIIRLWAPNAHAADPALLRDSVANQETAWFYHSGHPAVGAHTINAPGTDMRSWGVIAARYGLSGTFMWAANLGNDARPFRVPTYRPDDDRIGNGTLVYPGAQLGRVGLEARPGPIPSMRLKSWRRGLQDGELYRLARRVDEQRADALIQALVPVALADAVATGSSEPSWPAEASAWIDFRDALLDLLADGA